MVTMVDPNIVEKYTIGKEGFIVGLCEALKVPALINNALASITGRPPEIPYGVLAMMMMVNICDDHRPMYKLDEYFEYKDLDGIFHHPISLEQINDDRFGGFLDLFHKAGCREIFTKIAANAVSLYGIKINSINFDTTSKVMWGEYETPEGTVGVIKIDFGHSKDKRNDKKQRTIKKAIEKESKAIDEIAKTFKTREFACEKDAVLEIEKLESKNFKKIKYHDISFDIQTKATKRRGRPSNDGTSNIIGHNYLIEINSTQNSEKINRILEESCCFILCSTDLTLNGEELLKEYKTQDSVEKKFKQLKSPHFVNSIYLETPQRIEAFSYLMLISMLMLSVAEYVVRRGLAEDNDEIIGPGKIKMKRPTQRAIYEVFYSVLIRVVCHPDKPWERSLARPLRENVKKILKHLRIPENTFIRGAG